MTTRNNLEYFAQRITYKNHAHRFAVIKKSPNKPHEVVGIYETEDVAIKEANSKDEWSIRHTEII